MLRYNLFVYKLWFLDEYSVFSLYSVQNLSLMVGGNEIQVPNSDTVTADLMLSWFFIKGGEVESKSTRIRSCLDHL